MHAKGSDVPCGLPNEGLPNERVQQIVAFLACPRCACDKLRFTALTLFPAAAALAAMVERFSVICASPAGSVATRACAAPWPARA